MTTATFARPHYEQSWSDLRASAWLARLRCATARLALITLITPITPITLPLAGAPAFPGAEGFGAVATGGRGGDVYYVTHLSDSGPGSLREGITTATGPRTIVFAVSGTIILQSILRITKPNITIAGQTAPGDGICLRDYSLNIKDTHDIVVRCLRIRRGDVRVRQTGRPTSSSGLDTVSIDDSKNIIFDHCSLSWSCDEIFGIVQNENVTIQWCIVSEPLGDPLLHPYGSSHAYGLNCSATTLSIHHNLIAKYVFRGPQFEANDAVSGQGYEVWKEAVNNVMFDYRSSGSRYRSGVEEGVSNIPFRFHFINNYYIRNPSRTGAPEIEVHTAFGAVNTVKVHVAGNLGPSRRNDTVDQWRGVWTENDVLIRNAAAEVQAQMSDEPLFTPPIPITTSSASNAYNQVISLAGFNQVRDPVDLRVISNVVNRQFFDYLHSQTEVGGWPTLNTYDVPTDTDRDGMPDDWERALGMDPYVANNNHVNPDGYTDLENYLNWLADLHATGTANQPLDVNLLPFTAGISQPLCSVSESTHGDVILLPDGHTARFTPAPNFVGQASFRFAAVDAAGTGMTNAVGILIRPGAVVPYITRVSEQAGLLTLAGIGGTTNGTFYVLSSQDLSSPDINWTRQSTNQFDSDGNFSFTHPMATEGRFFKLLLP